MIKVLFSVTTCTEVSYGFYHRETFTLTGCDKSVISHFSVTTCTEVSYGLYPRETFTLIKGKRDQERPYIGDLSRPLKQLATPSENLIEGVVNVGCLGALQKINWNDEIQ